MTIKFLILQRRNARGRRRIDLSKEITKETRKELRKWHAQETEHILNEFKNLDRIDDIHREPIIHKQEPKQLAPDTFNDLLRSIYSSDSPNLENNYEALFENTFI